MPLRRDTASPPAAATPPAKRRRVAVALDLAALYRYHTEILAGVAAEARALGWELVLDEFPEFTLKKGRAGRKPDGIIARASPALAEAARRHKIPLVNVWFGSPVAETMPGVFLDHFGLGRLAGEHLRSRGLERFCFVMSTSSKHTASVAEMLAGIHAAIGGPARCGRLALPDLDEGDRGDAWNEFHTAVARFLASAEVPLGMVVAPSGGTARYLITALQDAGLRVPEDVAIVDLMGEPVIGDSVAPTITRIDPGYSQMGAAAARRLAGLMDGGSAAAADFQRISPVGLIVGDSTKLFICSDPEVSQAMDFIEKHLTQPIDVGRVAKAINVSRRTLDRRFHDAVGVPIATMVRRLRMQKAKYLLSSTSLLVKQVAIQSGFGTADRLRGCFVRDEGTTPLDYRRQRQSPLHPVSPADSAEAG